MRPLIIQSLAAIDYSYVHSSYLITATACLNLAFFFMEAQTQPGEKMLASPSSCSTHNYPPGPKALFYALLESFVL